MLKSITSETANAFKLRRSLYPVIGAFVLALLWAWFPVLKSLVIRWSQDAQYTHGFIVPIFAAYIAHQRSLQVPDCDSTPQKSGFIFIAIGAISYWVGAHIYFEWLEQASIIPVIFGLILLIGGKWLGRVTWPGVAFLFFMIPLPYAVETSMAVPMQQIAGRYSEKALQTMGVAAIRHGNLLRIEDQVLGIAEACNGMRIMVVFFAISTAMAMIIQRNWIEKLIIVCSAAPIALFCNILRIAITGLLYVYSGPKLGDLVFHDLAGWLMMPLALLILTLELKYLSLVFPAGIGMESDERPSITVDNETTISAAGGAA